MTFHNAAHQSIILGAFRHCRALNLFRPQDDSGTELRGRRSEILSNTQQQKMIRTIARAVLCLLSVCGTKEQTAQTRCRRTQYSANIMRSRTWQTWVGTGAPAPQQLLLVQYTPER